MNTEINKELIFNHFAGRATAIQKQMIEEWVTEPANREQYFLWLQEWEQHNWQYVPDVEKGMERHWNRINNPEYDGREPGIDYCSEEGEIARPNLFKKIYWLVAASFLITLWAGGWVFRDRIRYETFTTGYGETRRIDLADGSKVVLNSNSSLSVPRFGFGRQTREVLLNGEADFDIRHTADHQRFIVKTYKSLEVEVLGTEFNVYARPRGTKVVLNKGKVQLHYQEGESLRQLTMKPGDLVTMDSQGRANLQKTENPRKFSAWKAHRFVFEKTSLREVCYLFEDNFGVRVQIPDTSLAELTISGSFTALNAEELLGILTEDSGLNYEKSEDGKTIVLSY
ncbi:FecR domain-containing protein [Dyadobacter sp. LHD-138]|uniref:FecR family protein n=1 Tax=Dyadobacter sp. LHD-138 TaxID=3071413 RepID=UPI0027E1FF33|nr:FecR domain-containing protein [Dyadobacter sp. LHD-138]MDQ6477171.1 FecR domain-containing protein [Dyadobacter sp. LHD-138]